MPTGADAPLKCQCLYLNPRRRWGRRLHTLVRPVRPYFFLPFPRPFDFDLLFDGGFCASALPAADFDVLLVRPSRSIFDAADAALGDVTFLGALRCDNALPPAVFDFCPVDLLRSVLDALLAALAPVVFRFVIS